MDHIRYRFRLYVVVFIAAGAVACGEKTIIDGPGVDAWVAPPNAPVSSLARVLGPALLDDCPSGGVELEYGIDSNGPERVSIQIGWSSHGQSNMYR